MKKFIYIIAVSLLIACSTNNIDLPKTRYFKKLPKQGLNRNVILEVKGYDLYCNDSLISELRCIREGGCNCVKLNKGSNMFTIALAIDKDTDYEIIDSILHRLAQYAFMSVYLLTNDKKDSVGIEITNPWVYVMIPPPAIDSNYFKQFNHRLTIDNEVVYFDSNKVNSSEIDSLWEPFIGTNHFFHIYPEPHVAYSRIVRILDSFHLKFRETRRNYSIDKFGAEYENLGEYEKFQTDQKFRNSILIKHLE